MSDHGTRVDRRTVLRAGGAVATGSLAGLAGCTGGGGDGGGGDGGGGSTPTATETATPTPTQAEPTTVVHGAVKGGTTGILSTVMQAQGFDTGHGIALEPKLFASPPKVQKQLVFNQDIPTAYMGSIIATRMHAKDKHPQLVGPYMLNHTYVMSREDGDVQSPEDLAGKKVSFASTAADAWLKFVVLLEETHGVSSEDFEFVSAAPPAALNLLKKGEVDAILSFEPLATIALTKFDFQIIFSPREAWKETADLPLTTVDLAWVKSWYDENQAAAEGLARAFVQTQQYLNDNMNAVIDKHKDAFGFGTQEQVELGKERLTAIYPTEWNREAFVESELTMVRKARELGLIDVEPTEEIFNWVL